MKWINLTPHSIVVQSGDITETVLPSGTVARVTMTPGFDIFGPSIPTRTAPSYGTVTGIPDTAPNTGYIVSGMVLSRVSRSDVYAPDTGPDAIRDDAGRITAVRRLIQAGGQR